MDPNEHIPNKTMKTLLPSLAFLATMANCSELSHRKKIEPCPSVITNLHDHWHFDESKRIYFSHDHELGIQLLRDRKCLVGLSEKSILKLFGEPSLKRGNTFYYYLHPACHGELDISSDACSHLDIVFSAENRRVLSLEIGSSSSTP